MRATMIRYDLPGAHSDGTKSRGLGSAFMPVTPIRSACVAAALCIAALPARAQDVADFYRGRTVQLIIPSNMGGSVGLYGKLVADHIGRHIPGHPTVILVQMPGAGGLQSVEFISQVGPKDGTAFAEILSPSLLVPLMR